MQLRRRNLTLCVLALVGSLILAACGGLWGTPGPGPFTSGTALVDTPTSTPFQPGGEALPGAFTPNPIPSQPVATPVPSLLWVSPAVPDMLRQLAMDSGIPLTGTPDAATARLDFLSANSSNQPTSVWIYALVAPFPTTTDQVNLLDIQNAWAGNPSGPFVGRPLWMDDPTLSAFTALWGAPATGSVQVAAAQQLVDAAWADRPSWAIVPFEALEPRWKVLSVDGQSPLHNDFNPALYPLKITFNLDPAVFSLPATNRDANKLTVLAMTGVTALVRGTADRMEKKGLYYPGEAIRDVLRAADLTHVSNEISFADNCPTPDPWTDSLIFCSDPRYIGLLEDIGVDIVELTGNHMLDYGPADMLMTLDMYDQRGWKYFGGGRDLQTSLQPALVEHNGNRLAFIGCNYAGPASDWATDTRPGSTPCDFDVIKAELTRLRSQGYLPIMTFQYNEYYQPEPTPYEQADFRQMAEAGALIVSGSQAHVPAAMEFDGGAFIHYGLGNLFFDQMSHLMPDGSLIYDTRNVFVDRHIFYAGRYVGTELLTYIIEDYARPRPMTDVERLKLLNTIFSAGGW
jgi:poly-gamma-glutamate capsule biosynthesis protein CapA/YwtB (metallophosphatase superfamily)